MKQYLFIFYLLADLLLKQNKTKHKGKKNIFYKIKKFFKK